MSKLKNCRLNISCEIEPLESAVVEHLFSVIFMNLGLYIKKS